MLLTTPRPLAVTELFGRTVVTFPAEIDVWNAPFIRTQLLRLLDEGAGPLILDLATTRFCDCSGVGAIVGVGNHAFLLGKRVCLVLPPGGPVRRIATVTGLSRRFPTAPSLAAAHATLRQERRAYLAPPPPLADSDA